MEQFVDDATELGLEQLAGIGRQAAERPIEGPNRCACRADDDDIVLTRGKLPDIRELVDLRQLGEIGYVRGIEAKLAELAMLDENHPFTTALRPYLQAFDLDGFLDFLNKFDDEKVEPLG